ncbi:MAG: hypothetical protein ACI90V_007301, partial [Bacillariaceae sp.]
CNGGNKDAGDTVLGRRKLAFFFNIGGLEKIKCFAQFFEESDRKSHPPKLKFVMCMFNVRKQQ